MKRRYIFVVLLSFLFLTFATLQISAQNTGDEPRLEADPQAYVFSDDLDTSDWRSLFSLAWWASGAEEWEDAADEFAPAVMKLTATVVEMDERQKAEFVLEYMHKSFLGSYRLKQTRIDTLLETGGYNCVSSAVLYSILATAVGLDVSGVNTSDHAFSSVRIDDKQIDVETTNIYGFDPGTRTDFQDNFGKTTGFSYVPPGNYRDRNQIDIMKLFSLIIQNRIADAESAGRYSEAVGLAVDRWVLLGGGRGQEFEDLVTRMLNYGTLLSRAGREADALDWAKLAVQVYGTHPKWDEFIDGVANNLLVKLVRSGRLDEARSRLDMLRPRLTDKAVAALNFMVSDSELIAALDDVKSGGSEPDFLRVIGRIKEEGVVPEDRIREVEVNWRLYRLDLIAKTEGWAAAYEAAEDAIMETGPDPYLERARRTYLSNQKAELYNTAADKFNRRQYEEVIILMQNAIKEFPDEEIFRSLLSNTERILAGN